MIFIDLSFCFLFFSFRPLLASTMTALHDGPAGTALLLSGFFLAFVVCRSCLYVSKIECVKENGKGLVDASSSIT